MFNNPLRDDGWENDTSEKFIKNIASENDLSDGMDFANTRGAFMTMFRAQGSTAAYVAWAQDYACLINDKNKHFRLNHYICYICNGLDTDENFEPEDLQWVLTQEIRSDIMYSSVTQEKRTTDLLTYRREWFNKGGVPFMTFRDYCEWINIFAYDDAYQADRGDMEDVETGETVQTTNGWLTIEAFAVWKRMEKYENNVEYIAKSNEYTPYQSAITAPILKRQISTTVFPHVHDSGNQTVDSETGAVTDDRYRLPNLSSIDKTYFGKCNGWYNSSGTAYSEYKSLVPDHLRPVIDRFEYNENYSTHNITRAKGDDDTKTKPSIKESDLYDNAEDFIGITKFSKACDNTCGGKKDATKCQDSTHAANIIMKWLDRYGYFYDYDDWEERVWEFHNIFSWGWYGETHYGYCYGLKLDEKEREYGKFGEYEYVQLYIPYNTFKSACQQIKTNYGEQQGYFKYMKFWAKNGDYRWICDTTAYPYAPTGEGWQVVNNTYLSTNFWNHYDGTKNPVTGLAWDEKTYGADYIAKGFEEGAA